MSDSEILSITALSALGICLLVGLAKMAMKKQGHQETCDKVCGSLIFLAVVLMGVSQLLGEVSNFEDTKSCSGTCPNSTSCICPPGTVSNGSCTNMRSGCGSGRCLCNSGPEKNGYCCSASDPACKTGPRCTTTSDCASKMSCYHPDQSEDESSSVGKNVYKPTRGGIIPCRAATQKEADSQCQTGNWGDKPFSPGGKICHGAGCDFSGQVPVTCKAKNSPGPGQAICKRLKNLKDCNANSLCKSDVQHINCMFDYPCDGSTCSGNEDVGEGSNPFGTCTKKSDCGQCADGNNPLYYSS